MSGWHVGMQVVCIRQGLPENLPPAARMVGCVYPIKGLVYTIREFGVHDPDIILLEEIVNPIPPGSRYEPGYNRNGFRPVRKTSIDCFTKLLTPTEHEVTAITSEPVVASFPDHVSHERTCQFADADRSHSLPADFLPAGTLAGRLAAKLDGVLPLSHSLQSPMPKSSSVFALEHGDDGHGIH